MLLIAEIFVNDTKIEISEVSSVYLDSSLRYTINTNRLIKKAFANLNSYRNIPDRQTRILLCESLVLSHFNFCNSVYGPFLNYADKQRCPLNIWSQEI